MFFKKENWALAGDGDFTGTFHLFKGGHDLTGTFTSALAGVVRLPLPAAVRLAALDAEGVRGHRRRLGVVSAATRAFAFSIKPLGRRAAPTARFDASYTDVDLAEVTDFYELPGLRFAGRASGDNLLEWPLGRFHEHRGERSRDGDAAARRAADDGSVCRRCRPTPFAARMGTVRAAAAAAPPADRR